jgi:hypothetical protein
VLFLAFEANYVTTPLRPSAGGASFWGATLLNATFGAGLVAFAGWWLPRAWRARESGEPVLRGAFGMRPGRARPQAAPANRRTREPISPGHCLAAYGRPEPLWLRGLRWTVLGFFGVMLLVSVTTRHWEEGFITAMCAAYGLHLVSRIQGALLATRRLSEDRRSGALELLLTTPLTDSEIVRGHHDGLRRHLRTAFRALLGMNLVLEAMVVVFAEPLHMNGGAWAIFSAFFLGGAVLTLSDFGTLRWLGLRMALNSNTHLKAAAKVLGLLMMPPWLAFALTFLVAIQIRDEKAAAMVFALWAGLVLLYNGALVRASRLWLKPGLRKRVAESA